MFDYGDEVELTYPISTHVRFWRPEESRRRVIIVRSVRDLVESPLTVAEFLRRPYLLRSRYLIRAFEPRGRRWRQFYAGSSNEFWSPSVLQVGLYGPEDVRPRQIIGRPFEPTPDDRRQLVRALCQWSRFDLGDQQLRILATDLRLARKSLTTPS